ncbi:hypothetical protein B0H17DRAFT_1027101 [Mycena rosella]|uniref:Uncharacterized protein n=1 Tax=Mycena rosella TaxID=1033263 RepID=A0AAD7MCF9_MYCRO|nr:hypothetical protein B0H17DRAFT_1027101 [Mycena rosella]
MPPPCALILSFAFIFRDCRQTIRCTVYLNIPLQVFFFHASTRIRDSLMAVKIRAHSFLMCPGPGSLRSSTNYSRTYRGTKIGEDFCGRSRSTPGWVHTGNNRDIALRSPRSTRCVPAFN